MDESRRELDGFGYATTPYRIECRPAYGPHSKEHLIEFLDALQECGARAWWYSVATKGSYPLFPSKYLPCRDDAIDYFPWLVEEAHKRGISMFSWEYLCTAPMLGAQKPEWRWRFFDKEDQEVPRYEHFICYNSPYGELMKKYCVEVVKELGFDGIWFDGSLRMALTGEYACCCDFCAAKYRKETGRSLPPTIDLSDLQCRQYLEWRYDDHTEYWRDLSGYVRERQPKAIIVFNFFNRFCIGVECGCPLRRMAGDAPEGPDNTVRPPMEGMISAERGNWPQQVLLMAKTLRAINDNYPIEIWAPGRDSPRGSGPDPNPTSLIFHGQTCATGGGFASFGMGILDNRRTIRALTRGLDPIAPYVGGEQEAVVGLVLSGSTKDYAYILDGSRSSDLFYNYYGPREGKKTDSHPTWRSVHGMHNILNGLHLTSDVLLDNMLSMEFLSRYQAVVLPDVQCMSDEAGAELTRYVEEGGLLLTTGETGTKTPLGEERERGVLDDLFGITWRDTRSSAPVLEVHSPLLIGSYDSETEQLDDGLPPRCRLSGLARLVRSECAQVLAAGSYVASSGGSGVGPQGLTRPEGGESVLGAAVLARDVGKGRATHVAPKIAHDYALWGPRRYSRNLVGLLLLDRLVPPFTTDAPANVVVTLWKQESRRTLHLLNVPSSLLILPASGECFDTAPPLVLPEDFTPTCPIRVTVPGDWKEATSPTDPDAVHFERGEGKIIITLEKLDQHAVIVVQ